MLTGREMLRGDRRCSEGMGDAQIVPREGSSSPGCVFWVNSSPIQHFPPGSPPPPGPKPPKPGASRLFNPCTQQLAAPQLHPDPSAKSREGATCLQQSRDPPKINMFCSGYQPVTESVPAACREAREGAREARGVLCQMKHSFRPHKLNFQGTSASSIWRNLPAAINPPARPKRR